MVHLPQNGTIGFDPQPDGANSSFFSGGSLKGMTELGGSSKSRIWLEPPKPKMVGRMPSFNQQGSASSLPRDIPCRLPNTCSAYVRLVAMVKSLNPCCPTCNLGCNPLAQVENPFNARVPSMPAPQSGQLSNCWSHLCREKFGGGLQGNRDPYIIHLNIALSMVVSPYFGGKSHVSNGCKMYLLRSPGELAAKLETPCTSEDIKHAPGSFRPMRGRKGNGKVSFRPTGLLQRLWPTRLSTARRVRPPAFPKFVKA